jgi:hypothetical protein
MNVTIREIGTQGCELDPVRGPQVGSKCELYFDWRGIQLGFVAVVVGKDAEGRLDLMFLSVDRENQKRLKELCATLRTPSISLPKGPEVARPIPKSAEAQVAASPTVSTGAPASFPPSAAELKRRQLPRYVGALPAYFLNPATGAASGGFLVNLSIAGGRLEGRGLPEPGHQCEFQTEWQDERVVLRGDVVWKHEERVGVKFSPHDEGTENLLRRICSNLSLELPASAPAY